MADWSTVVSDVLNKAGDVYAQNQQAKIAQANADAAFQRQLALAQLPFGNATLATTAGGGTTLLLIGGAVLVMFLMSQRRR